VTLSVSGVSPFCLQGYYNSLQLNYQTVNIVVLKFV